ncbi:MAG: hypothetical protein ACLT40_09420 [Fusobacterium sp.]
MAYLTAKEVLSGSKFAVNDILNYHNVNYLVKDDIQNCFVCPFKDKCDVVECHSGLDLSFEPISEIESLILLGGVRGR